MTIGAFHVVLCAGIEPDFCHGAISTRWFSFTFAHWRGVIRGILCVLPSRSVVYGFATISADWTGSIVTEMTPGLGKDKEGGDGDEDLHASGGDT